MKKIAIIEKCSPVDCPHCYAAREHDRCRFSPVLLLELERDGKIPDICDLESLASHDRRVRNETLNDVKRSLYAIAPGEEHWIEGALRLMEQA